MAHRYFEGKVHAQLYAKYRTVPPKDLIQRIITYIQEKYTGELNVGVDVGCGSGQSTQFLAPYFNKVIGTDISEAQIEKGKESNTFPNIEYKVAPAETIPVPNDSVQLISASQAAHWFDLPKFYKEGQRALCPGGVLALYGYEFPKFIWKNDPSKNKLLDNALNQLYFVEMGNSVFPQSREVYLGRYSLDKYTIPLNDTLRDETFFHEMDTKVSDIINYCYTWSGYQEYCKVHGEEKGVELIKKFQDKIMNILDVTTNPEDTVFTKKTSFFLLMGRK